MFDWLSANDAGEQRRVITSRQRKATQLFLRVWWLRIVFVVSTSWYQDGASGEREAPKRLVGLVDACNDQRKEGGLLALETPVYGLDPEGTHYRSPP